MKTPITREMIEKVAASSGAYQFDDDLENLFRDPPPAENMGESACGYLDVMPEKTMRNKYIDKEHPLALRPDYSGDFLDKLRARLYKNRNADDGLQDFDKPSDLIKYIPEVQPRDLQDEFYDINRPGDDAGHRDLKQYDDRGWDENDAPEISEDKILRERGWSDKRPVNKPEKFTLPLPENYVYLRNRIVNSYISKQQDFKARSVVARFLLNFQPDSIDINLNSLRVSKMLRDLDRSQIFTKKNNWRKPDFGGVTARLITKNKKQNGSWTFEFTTSSGSGYHNTIFQFIPKGDIKDIDRLHVRCCCSCNSWLYYGAQWNASHGGYLYISPKYRIRLKFSDPKIRDPYHRFTACKHVLACIPVLRQQKLADIEDEMMERLKREPEIEVDTRFHEPVEIPQELKECGKHPALRKVIDEWDRSSAAKRRKFVEGLNDARDVAWLAHRYPPTATKFVVKKLNDMSKIIPLTEKDVPDFKERVHRNLLKGKNSRLAAALLRRIM